MVDLRCKRDETKRLTVKHIFWVVVYISLGFSGGKWWQQSFGTAENSELEKTLTKSSSAMNAAEGESEPTRALLMTSPCSGGGFTISELNSIAGMNFGGELMRRHPVPKVWKEESWSNFESRLERAYKMVKRPNSQVIGFKLMFDLIPSRFYQDFAKWLNRENIHVILLRRNPALQLASAVQKLYRGRTGVKNTGHVFSEELLASLIVDPKLTVGPAIKRTMVMEENQWIFSSYLQVYAACAAVFEVRYEDLDGPRKEQWLDAIAAFLGFAIPRTLKPESIKRPLKVGKRLCEERLEDIGDDYEALKDVPLSHRTCLMLKNREASCEVAPDLLFNATWFLPPPIKDSCRYRQDACGELRPLIDLVANNSNMQ